MIDSIIDLYHMNNIDMDAAAAGGVVALIHKASEGSTVRDSEYRKRRQLAKEKGLLWGAYHFSSGVSVADQVANFLEAAAPDDEDLVALDWEPSSSGTDMTIDQARRFVEMVRMEIGRWPVLYGGRLLRENIGGANDEILGNCPLWYSRYANAPIGYPKNTWSTCTLWQYTDGNSGPEPHVAQGIGRCDRNRFDGTVEVLRQRWPFVESEL